MNIVKEWIDKWVELFPSNVKWNNEKIRSKVDLCLNNMNKFIKLHPNITKEQIFVATQNYLDVQQEKNWEFTMKAHYFILKQGKGSKLLEYCEMLGEKDQPQENNTFYTNFI